MDDDEHGDDHLDIIVAPPPAAPVVRRVPACSGRRKRHRYVTPNGMTCNHCIATHGSSAESDAGPVALAPSAQDEAFALAGVPQVGNVDAGPAALAPAANPAAETMTTTAGQRFQLDPKDVEAFTAMVKDVAWPNNVRRVIKGHGECLGATYDANGARLGRSTSKREALCMKFNSALAKALGDTHFEWGSLQININSVSKEHRDAKKYWALRHRVVWGVYRGKVLNDSPIPQLGVP